MMSKHDPIRRIAAVLTALLFLSAAALPACAEDRLPASPAPSSGRLASPDAFSRFGDLADGKWYSDSVRYCIENGLMEGMTDTEFGLTEPVSRAMIVTVLWRLDGQRHPDYAMAYPDVPAGKWYTEAIRWATAEKIVGGYDDGSFGPDDPAVREQLAVMLYRYAQYKKCTASSAGVAPLDGFSDADRIHGYAAEAMTWAVSNGLFEGADGLLLPLDDATRAQAACILKRLAEYLETAEVLPEQPDTPPEPFEPDTPVEPTEPPIISRCYIWPVPSHHTISSYYSEQRSDHRHAGIDIWGMDINGQPVVAAASGTVSEKEYASTNTGSYGIHCMIDHADGKSTVYAHLSTVAVSPGQYVEQGQLIGFVGATGNATSPHLHFECRNGGVQYDPLSEF